MYTLNSCSCQYRKGNNRCYNYNQSGVSYTGDFKLILVISFRFIAGMSPSPPPVHRCTEVIDLQHHIRIKPGLVEENKEKNCINNPERPGDYPLLCSTDNADKTCCCPDKLNCTYTVPRQMEHDIVNVKKIHIKYYSASQMNGIILFFRRPASLSISSLTSLSKRDSIFSFISFIDPVVSSPPAETLSLHV